MSALWLLLAAQDPTDEIELLNGQKFKGQFVEEADDAITFEIKPSGQKRKFPTKDVASVTVAGEKRIVNDRSGKKKADPKGKSRAEVDSLIKKMGATPPDWYAKTPLNYPKTLDLTWPQPPPTPGWDQNKNVGQFIWSVVNENPSKWKEGVRFMHYLLTVHKDNDLGHKKTFGTALLYRFDCRSTSGHDII